MKNKLTNEKEIDFLFSKKIKNLNIFEIDNSYKNKIKIKTWKRKRTFFLLFNL
jgi:hypothetical protein